MPTPLEPEAGPRPGGERLVPGRRGAAAGLPAGLLLLLLAVHLPAFLRMPLDTDVTQYDLCARTVLRGGVFYRDALDTNLPGMLWCQMAIRSLAGWSSEALRVADAALVAL